MDSGDLAAPTIAPYNFFYFPYKYKSVSLQDDVGKYGKRLINL